MAKMRFIYPYIAVMPDAHWGMGSCVGSVIPTKDAIMPASVGVDIGCGMIAHKLNLKREAFNGLEEEVRTTIMRTVPTGRTDNGGDRDIGSWQGFPHQRGNVPGRVIDRWENELHEGYLWIMEDNGKALKKARTYQHLGTLGTGNHFIELASDENEDVWLIIHSGSRGIGNKVGSHFITVAQELCDRWLVDLPDRNLAFFPKGERRFDEYWRALQWAQSYAWINRELMMHYSLDAIKRTFGDRGIKAVDEVHCHHNYAERENHFKQNIIVTRKGAVRARKTDRGIIPGSMGEKSFIVRGKQDKHALHSCSHGAGRVMSRAEAKRSISVDDHKSDTEGVFCDKSSAVIDESPQAYKPIDAVMAAQADLVDIEFTLKGFINVKGLGEDRKRKGKKKNA
jgi:tRNA-splicing ligase RtcB